MSSALDTAFFSVSLGISPWRTARDLYYDKLGIAKIVEDEDNWVQLEIGNLLEPLVARIFAKKTGLRVYQRKAMFRHPKYHDTERKYYYCDTVGYAATAFSPMLAKPMKSS